jgi:defect-in-organelle-trafficking protein DotD
MRNLFLFVFCPVLCISIAGCQVPPRNPADDLPDLGNIELGEAAIAVSKSLDDLAALSAERQVARVEPQTQEQLDYNMYQLASVDWSGPAEPLIRRLAQAVDYHVRVIGKAPPNIVIVNISKRNVSVGELLRDVALQIQRDADLLVYPQSKLIELHYRK